MVKGIESSVARLFDRVNELAAALEREPDRIDIQQQYERAAQRARQAQRALFERGGLIALAVLVLAACGVPQPLNLEVEAPAGADDAAAIVVMAWSERVPRASRLDLGDLPPVRWFAGDCLDYGDGVCWRGMTWSPNALSGAGEIQLIATTTIHESALAHEALHWALDEVEGDGDSDHRAGAWNAVGAVEAILQEAGL